jgi:Bacterial mobilisation protein (MobC)
MPRTIHLGVRLSDDELARLLPAATAAGMSPATWLRHVALASLSAGAPASKAAPGLSATDRLARTVGTRLTSAQYAALAERAQECGLPVAAYVRRALLGQTPVARPRRGDVRPAIAALNRVGNNLNQLTKLAHRGMVLSGELASTVARVLAEVRRIRDALLAMDE